MCILEKKKEEYYCTKLIACSEKLSLFVLSLHDGSFTAIYGWLLKAPSATYVWSLKTLSGL
jgi:hypothetical protein